MVSRLENYEESLRRYVARKTKYLELIKNPDLDISEAGICRKVYHSELQPYFEPERKTRSGRELSGAKNEDNLLMRLCPYLNKLEILNKEIDISWGSLFRGIGQGVAYAKRPSKKNGDNLLKNLQTNQDPVKDRTIRIYYIEQGQPVIEEGLIVATPRKEAMHFSPEFTSMPGGRRVEYSELNENACCCRHQINFSKILKINDREGTEFWYSSKEDFSKWAGKWTEMEIKLDAAVRRAEERERRKQLDDLNKMTIDKLEPVEES